MQSFLVVRVLEFDSFSVSNTQVFSGVEIRSFRADSDCEKAALKESAESYRVDFEKYQFSARMAAIVTAESEFAAANESEDMFEEILDLKAVENPISRSQLSPIGFYKNLFSGEVTPILHHGFMPSMSFYVAHGSVQQYDFVNYVLKAKNDLSFRYLRSLHWSRKSLTEKNGQMHVLFCWFAIEALLKENENDKIGNMIRWFLGFPNGKQRMQVSKGMLSRLSNHPSYSYWNQRLPKILDDIRDFRNDSVHSGFRVLDFPREDIQLWVEVMKFGVSRCQGAVRSAIVNKVQSVGEFKDYVGIIFDDGNRVNDVHGTVIYSLDRLL